MKILVTLVFFISCCFADGQGKCPGKFINPITDIAWDSMFPIKIGGQTLVKGKNADPNTLSGVICTCKFKGIPVPGVPISFWEPARLIDVTRTPWCLVSLGGIKLMNSGVKMAGDISSSNGKGNRRSFYHTHFYVYPVFALLEILTNFPCVEVSAADLPYVSELDPFWRDGQKASILNPEAILFGNPVAQLACMADAVAASASLPIDKLIWCCGAQGSMYPLTGHVADHIGGVQASLLLAGRTVAKLHRMGLLRRHTGKDGACKPVFDPVIKKSNYRVQMTFPVANTDRAYPMGATSTTWEAHKETPGDGEHFGYLIWRKLDCCLTPLRQMGGEGKRKVDDEDDVPEKGETRRVAIGDEDYNVTYLDNAGDN